MYAKAIRFKIDKHNEIIDLVKWATENNLIQFGLGEFVISRKWLDLAKIKSGEVKMNFQTTFDSSELV